MLAEHQPAPGLEHIDRGGLLLRIEIARQQVVGDTGELLVDPFAGDVGRLARHVLAGCISGCVTEARVQHVGDGVLLYFNQLTASGG